MLKNTTSRDRSRTLIKRHKIAIAGVAALGAAALAFSAVPGNATTTASEAVAAPVAFSSEQFKTAQAGVADQFAEASLQAKAAEAKKKAADEAAKKKAAAEAAAKKKAEAERKAKEAASRSAKRAAVKPVAAKTYTNNLDGWIKHSLDIMRAKGIPGTYNGLYRNIMRESSGNPNAINNWDINAQNGVPSQGLLQVIPPTFQAYHVSGTSWNITDPVANITAAANYAADRYGSIDNVFGAY
ncbi:transglycosylase SLT domain-containing protein [Streptomyces dysideae]|uniref:Lytic transglycosylase n=1 Tax=Streptomyces dysideae TaxID=909626 RepID=A0A101V567_9ACTN|nr:transglycosylase SLT domain-containing protein [Streptomyces dysideae]KUO22634.1 lytic transglycosylase [Streptomyces dysideae]